MTIYIGIDDTDTRESRGTGRLARAIAAELSRSYPVFGVTRHQLFLHPAIPYTSHNSAAVIHIPERGNGVAADDLFARAKELLLADFIEGSDPGICLAADRQMGQGVTRFGFIAKREVVTQEEARTLARQAGILLEGLGGTEDGLSGRWRASASRHRGTTVGLSRKGLHEACTEPQPWPQSSPQASTG